MKTKIAIDIDGPLLDYHEAYARVWGRAFGEVPKVVNRNAYWAMDRYGVPKLDQDQLKYFMSHFDEEFWLTMKPMPGAVEACQRLVDAGYELISISATVERFTHARHQNLKDVGLPITTTFCTGRTEPTAKAQILRSTRPVAYVDDCVHYLTGIPNGIYVALIESGMVGSPNQEEAVWDLIDGKYHNFPEFVDYWLLD